MKKTRTITISCEDITLELEVNPEKVGISYPQNYKTKELVGGELVQIGSQGVRKIELDTFFPHAESPFKTRQRSMESYWYVLRRWMDARRVVELYIRGHVKGAFYIIELERTAVEGDKDMNVVISLIEKLNITKRRVKKKKKNGGKDDKKEKSRVLYLKTPMMKGEDVTSLQTALNEQGYEKVVGAVDGIFGKRTNKGVRAFQKKKKLTVDGKAGKNTFNALGLKWVE